MESFHIRLRTALKARRAFTLVELMVVVTIIGIISVVTLNSQGSFNKTLILANTAYDIALTLRSAETFGIGSRVTSTSIANAGYGVHFQTGNVLTLFADTSGLPTCSISDPPDCKPGDHVYTSGADTLVQAYTLGNGIFVYKLCANATCGLSSLDVVFARPNPDAFISANSSYSSLNTSACIIVASPSAPAGPYRYIKVMASGAIIANVTPCP